MKKYIINSTHRQFYIADAILKPLAPEDWNDDHIKQKHNTLKNITALCPEGDITARITIIGPDSKCIIDRIPDFVVKTNIEIESGEIGIFEWPFNRIEKYTVDKGLVDIEFSGYDIDKVEIEKDYYVVIIKSAQQGDAPERFATGDL